MKYLQQRYDLTAWQMRGASAGALVATLAACNVGPDQALICADRLARENGIFERKLGLAGMKLTSCILARLPLQFFLSSQPHLSSTLLMRHEQEKEHKMRICVQVVIS